MMTTTTFYPKHTRTLSRLAQETKLFITRYKDMVCFHANEEHPNLQISALSFITTANYAFVTGVKLSGTLHLSFGNRCHTPTVK